MFKKYFYVFFISMVPIVELRGAIPFSQAIGLPLIPSYILAIIGNMIPVPFIYFFARKLLNWMSERPSVIGKAGTLLLQKGERGGKTLEKKAGKNGIFLALLLFVGIPLPGTGAWTGTLAASILELDFKTSVTACMGGVLLAGIIMSSGSRIVMWIMSLF